MVRLFFRTCIALVASAIGLIVAAIALDGLKLSAGAFVISVAIFTLTTAVMQPFMTKIALQNLRALIGATALISTFIGLLITALVTDGLKISGVDTWLLGTLIVWVVSLVATLLLPFLLVKWGVKSMMADQPRGRP